MHLHELFFGTIAIVDLVWPYNTVMVGLWAPIDLRDLIG